MSLLPVRSPCACVSSLSFVEAHARVDHEFRTGTESYEQESGSQSSTVLQRFGDYAGSEFPRLLRPQLEEALDAIIAERLTSETVVGLAQGVFQQVLLSFQRQEGQAWDPPSESSRSQVESAVAEVPSLGAAFQSAFVDSLDDLSFNLDEWLGGSGDMFSMPDSGYGSLLDKKGGSDTGL